MKPMLLTEVLEIPVGDDWLYEPKYDGFRCILVWEEPIPILKSRNGNVLNHMFPEIIDFCIGIYNRIKPHLPLVVDGELVYLINSFRSNFSLVQQRSRMRSKEVISTYAKTFPCHYVIFDLLQYKGELQTDRYLKTRKQILTKLFSSIKLPISINYQDVNRVQAIDIFEDSESLWNIISVSNGEGIIAKKKTSRWVEDSRSTNWLKIKNWKYVTVIVYKYDNGNGYFHGGVYQDDQFIEVVTFRHGMKAEELKTLVDFFQANGSKLNEVWELEPSICIDIACIDFDSSKLREPRFHAFRLDMSPAECNWKLMQRQLNPLPQKVEITHPDKPIWPIIDCTKDDFLLYLQKISPYILPFLKDRLLTVVRYPHGITGNVEQFFQKHAPNYAPDFIRTQFVDDINYILCNDIESLLWLGNQLALEFHIPFQTMHSVRPTEIVFDLDPPSVHEFSLAVNAALHMKAISDQFGLQSFVKTSGGKGMQLYIPLPIDTFSYEETSIFTEFVCNFLVEQFPQWYTTERLKKNRDKKLYLDFVQHREGKTIIAPYSPRGNSQGLIATPLNWDEVNESLRPEMFTIPAVLERIKKQGDPFRSFRYDVDENAHNFKAVLTQLKGLS